MPQFTFKLDPLLQQKRRVETAAQRQLAELLHRRVTLQGRLTRQQQEVTRSKSQLTDALQGNVDLTAVGAHARFSMTATADGFGVVRELAALEQQILQSRAELNDARRQRKAIEALRERKLNEWKREQQRRDAIALDEAATQGWIRNNFDNSMGVAA